MTSRAAKTARLEVHPLTLERWGDFERLFGERGACGGCWCMWWRRTRAEFEKHKGAGNKRAMKQIVRTGEVPGLLGYVGGEPVAWCSIAPRQAYPGLERSRILKAVDDQAVWSVTCFFIPRPLRRKGVALAMLRSAVHYAACQGARLVEGYPVEPKQGTVPDAFAWVGLASLFAQAGFREVTRRSATRPIMRRKAARRKGKAVSVTRL